MTTKTTETQIGQSERVVTKAKKVVATTKPKKAKKVVAVEKTKTAEATAVSKTIETTRVRTQFKDVIGEIKREGEFTFAKAYDKVTEGFVRIVKYADTTIKVFDKNDFEVTPAKPTICRAIAILDSFDETQLNVYSKKSTTRSSGARLLKLLGDKSKEQVSK